MRRTVFILFLLTILVSFTTSSKKSYPKDYFRSPVASTVRLSGTFGELRPNHLHAGIDIKAQNGKVGQAVFSAAKGYVSRIKVKAGGYGKVLYINHPNGYTTVYAHLQKFTKELEKFVKEKQYQKQSFEIDLFPRPNQFSLEKGEQLGKIGITGSSQGPHLHFEIRDTKSEKPVNPLLFGIDVTDNRPPIISGLKVYFLNDKKETFKTKTYKLKKIGGKYKIYGDTISLGAWRVGFGLKTYDHMTGVSNLNGVYSVNMLQDDVPVYNFEMETFSFAETRYINAHLDYEARITKRSYYNRCYLLPGNKLSIYNEKSNKGVVELFAGKARKITMIAKDLNGNEANLEFWVKRSEVDKKDGESFNYFLPFDEENMIKTDNLQLYFPKGTFYNNLYMKYNASIDASSNVYSAVHHVHDLKTPVHKYFDIEIKPVKLPPELKDKAFIAYCGNGNVMSNCGGSWKNGMLKTKTRSLGDYCIMVDNTPPKITPIRFSANMAGYSRMTFKIKDDMPTMGKAAALKYKATVDGKWILMEFDIKSNLLNYRFDDRISKGKHNFRLEVTDDRGNQTVYERSFIR
jgi:Peptidase family M23